VGEVKVSDRNPLETEKMLEELYGRKYLRNPQVTVFIKEYRHRRVSVVGAVNKPGTFEMIGPRTLFEMLSEAGGLKEDAGDIVHIIRRGSADARKASSRPAGTPPEKAETIIVNLRSALTKGDTELGALPIQHGDVINVPHAGYAYVTGEVLKPGKVMVKQGLTVTQAVAMAGPLTPVASGQAQVLRFDPQGQRQVIPVDLQSLSKGEGLDIPIQENDVVVIPSSAGKKFWQGIASIFRGAVSVGYHLTP
jgi:polysaccharide export outer membrane protein